MSSSNLPCFVCGCLGHIDEGGSRLVADCKCMSCNSACVFSNIDRCISCRGVYKLMPATGSSYIFACENSCDVPSSALSSRFRSLDPKKLNARDQQASRTLLHTAVLSGDSKLTWDLLKLGANPYVQDMYGITPCDLARSLLTSAVASSGGMTASRDLQVSDLRTIYDILPKQSLTKSLTSDTVSLAWNGDDLPPVAGSVPRAMSERAPTAGKAPLNGSVPALTRPTSALPEHIPPPPTSSRSVSVGQGSNADRLSKRRVHRPGAAIEEGTQMFTPLTLARLGNREVDLDDAMTDVPIENVNDIVMSSTEASHDVTIAELTRAIVNEPDIVHRKGASAESHDSLTGQCSACMDTLPFAEMTYACTHLGCTGCLCQDCLYRLVFVTITRALYAVPVVRCPGRCMRRIPTALWRGGLEGVHVSPEDSKQLKPGLIGGVRMKVDALCNQLYELQEALCVDNDGEESCGSEQSDDEEDGRGEGTVARQQSSTCGTNPPAHASLIVGTGEVRSESIHIADGISTGDIVLQRGCRVEGDIIIDSGGCVHGDIILEGGAFLTGSIIVQQQTKHAVHCQKCAGEMMLIYPSPHNRCCCADTHHGSNDVTVRDAIYGCAQLDQCDWGFCRQCYHSSLSAAGGCVLGSLFVQQGAGVGGGILVQNGGVVAKDVVVQQLGRVEGCVHVSMGGHITGSLVVQQEGVVNSVSVEGSGSVGGIFLQQRGRVRGSVVTGSGGLVEGHVHVQQRAVVSGEVRVTQGGFIKGRVIVSQQGRVQGGIFNGQTKINVEAALSQLKQFFSSVNDILAASGNTFHDVYKCGGAMFGTVTQDPELIIGSFADFAATVYPGRLPESCLDDAFQEMENLVNEGLYESEEEERVGVLYSLLGELAVLLRGMEDIRLLHNPFDIATECKAPPSDADAETQLTRKYESNAESLLMMRCGSCDESQTLFYPSDRDRRAQAVNVMLQGLDSAEVLPLLKNWAAFGKGQLSPALFVASLVNTFMKQHAESSNLSTYTTRLDSGRLEGAFEAYMRTCLGLLIDTERRFAAQLELYRRYPKIKLPCCETNHCFLCKVEGHHRRRTCEEVQREEIGRECQYCPGCGVPTLRTEGCDEILCVCGSMWEWKSENDDSDSPSEDDDDEDDDEEDEDSDNEEEGEDMDLFGSASGTDY